MQLSESQENLLRRSKWNCWIGNQSITSGVLWRLAGLFWNVAWRYKVSNVFQMRLRKRFLLYARHFWSTVWWGTRSACAGSGAGRTWCVITTQRLESVLGWNKRWRICIKPAAESLKPGAGSSTSSQQECWACPRPSIWAVCLLDQLITKYWIPEIDAKSKCISKLMRSRPVESYHNASLFYTLILYSPKTPKCTFRRRKSITSGVLWREDGLFSASIKVFNCGPNCWKSAKALKAVRKKFAFYSRGLFFSPLWSFWLQVRIARFR